MKHHRTIYLKFADVEECLLVCSVIEHFGYYEAMLNFIKGKQLCAELNAIPIELGL
jgi:hypothetical protein